MKKVYCLRHRKVNGDILVTFEKGILIGVEMEVKEPLTPAQFNLWIKTLPYLEEDINDFEALGFSISLEFATNEKIALFCEMYEEKTKRKYKVTAADSGKMKLVRVSKDMLMHYFNVSTNFLVLNKYSVSNFVKYYNEINAEIARMEQGSHPSYYSKEYEKTLQPDEMAGYWKHLRGLGLNPKKNHVGNVIDWV